MNTFYQLWCYYETADEWKSEGFFRTKDEATAHLQILRDNAETPCMCDWCVLQVTGWR